MPPISDGRFLTKGKFYVWKETFAVVKSRKPLMGSFAIVKDKNEITCIAIQSKIKKNKNIIKINKGWRVITFDMVLPFRLVGFLAKMSKILANEKISIFVVSSYSADHILVKEKDIKKAVIKLKSLRLKQIK